jgi:hypothetical protein
VARDDDIVNVEENDDVFGDEETGVFIDRFEAESSQFLSCISLPKAC